jgi:membrane fusion protein (multidrug efflux system)
MTRLWGMGGRKRSCSAGRTRHLTSRVTNVLLMAGCAVAISACGKDAPEEVETKTVVPVTTEAAATGSVRATIHATGTVEPAPGADHRVTAPENARIVEIPKAEGDRVRRGDLLVRFEIPTLGADSEAKRAEVDRAEARLTNARTAKTRAHDLFDRGVAARKEVEDADRELSDAVAALREAEAARRASATLAERTDVRARFDGIVAKRSHNPGDVVDASATDPILRVIDPRRLEVVASVPIGDVAQIRAGAAARLLLSAEETVLLKVVSRPAAVEAQTGAAPVRLAFSGETSLPAGTPVQVDIDGPHREHVLVVPLSAIVREGDDTAVFVVSGDKAQRKPVMLGLSDAEHVEIRSGIKPGDMVIVRGQNGLPDGATVTTAAGGK